MAVTDREIKSVLKDSTTVYLLFYVPEIGRTEAIPFKKREDMKQRVIEIISRHLLEMDPLPKSEMKEALKGDLSDIEIAWSEAKRVNSRPIPIDLYWEDCPHMVL